MMINKKYDGKVLVLGSGTRSFLAVIRSLGRKNLDVHVAWCNPESVALYSRYITKIHSILGYTAVSDDWLQSFIEILKAENYDLVIPCDDPGIIPLQYNRQKLEKYAKFYLLNDDLFNTCNNKSKITKLAESLKICLPNYIVTSDINEIIQFSEKYSYPVVLKPKSSFTIDQPDTRFEVKKAYAHEELIKLSNEMLQYGELQIQENFIGKGVGVEVLASEGKILAAFQHERIHEPMMGGGSSYRKSVSLDKDLLNATEKLIASLSYTGVAMVEFKVNEKLEKWVLIEINARFWGSLPLSVAAGADFPYWLYQMLTANKQSFPNQYKNIYCRNTAFDYEWFIFNLEADRNDPLLSSIPFRQVALEIFNVTSFKERNDTLQIDDLKPGIMEWAKLAKRVSHSVKSRATSWIKSTYIYKKYKLYKCHKTLMTSRNILFLCYGNICRSPFAELYARDIFPSDFTISSCGIHDKTNRKSPDVAIKAALVFNTDLSNHRSIQLTEEIANEADIIFVFDDIHYDQLINKYPFVQQYTFMISSLNMGLPRIIEDPYGRKRDDFINTYDTIKISIDSLRKSFKGVM